MGGKVRGGVLAPPIEAHVFLRCKVRLVSTGGLRKRTTRAATQWVHDRAALYGGAPRARAGLTFAEIQNKTSSGESFKAA